MYTSHLVNQTSFVFAACMFFVSFFLFYRDTQLFWKSLFAALLAACLFWMSYVLMRWLFLALKRERK